MVCVRSENAYLRRVCIKRLHVSVLKETLICLEEAPAELLIAYLFFVAEVNAHQEKVKITVSLILCSLCTSTQS